VKEAALRVFGGKCKGTGTGTGRDAGGRLMCCVSDGGYAR